MDKIYSRKRIKIPIFMAKEIGKFQVVLLIMIILIFISVVSFLIASYPIFVASCESAASSKAMHIMTEEVNNVMNEYNYNDLIGIEKDANGNIKLMNSNVVLVNKIMATISQNIQNQIDHSPTTMVYINYGTVTGISILKRVGLKFDIELETAGAINHKMKYEFESVGVNQSLHRIYLQLNTRISILTPIGAFGKDIDSTVLLTEAIIVGEVPDTYYNLEGMNQDDILNVIE